MRDLLLTSATKFRDSMIILYVGLGTYVEKTGLEEIDKEFLHYLQGGAFVFIHLK